MAANRAGGPASAEKCDKRESTVARSQVLRRAPVVLRVLLIICVFAVPWFDVNYYVGSVSFNLFTVGGILSSSSSIVRALASLSASASPLPDWLESASVLFYCFGVIPLVFLGVDLYLRLRHRTSAWYGYGPYAVIAIQIVGLLLATQVGSDVSTGLSSLSGDADLHVISMNAGWFLTLALAAATIYVDASARRWIGARPQEQVSSTGVASSTSSTFSSCLPGGDGSYEDAPANAERELEEACKLEQKALAMLGKAALPVLERHQLEGECAEECRAAKEAMRASEAIAARIELERHTSEQLTGRDEAHEGVRICPVCHALVLPDDTFCAGCGTRVSEMSFNEADEGMCPVCKESVRAGARFCASCGAKFV